jgi:hypothetical protein
MDGKGVARGVALTTGSCPAVVTMPGTLQEERIRDSKMSTPVITM